MTTFQVVNDTEQYLSSTEVNHDHSPCLSYTRTISSILWIVLGVALFSAGVFMLVLDSGIPFLPGVSITTVSTTVHDVDVDVDDNRIAADLDVGIRFINRAEKSMIFDHLAASASASRGSHYHNIAKTNAVMPFELGGEDDPSSDRTVLLRLKNVTLGVDSWDVVGDGIDQEEYAGKRSGFTSVDFVLTSNVTYRGKAAWLIKRRMPIDVACSTLKVPFSFSANNSMESWTNYKASDYDYCEAEGLVRDPNSICPSPKASRCDICDIFVIGRNFEICGGSGGIGL
ncbi:hypothetical protein TorRG33x02_070660, partial [Trema orientale]